MALSLGSLEFDVLLVPRHNPDAAPIKAGTITVALPPLELRGKDDLSDDASDIERPGR